VGLLRRWIPCLLPTVIPGGIAIWPPVSSATTPRSWRILWLTLPPSPFPLADVADGNCQFWRDSGKSLGALPGPRTPAHACSGGGLNGRCGVLKSQGVPASHPVHAASNDKAEWGQAGEPGRLTTRSWYRYVPFDPGCLPHARSGLPDGQWVVRLTSEGTRATRCSQPQGMAASSGIGSQFGGRAPGGIGRRLQRFQPARPVNALSPQI